MSQFQQKNFIHTTQVQPTVVPANPRLATVGQFIAMAKVGADIHPIIQTTGSTLVSWLGYVCMLSFFLNDMPTQLPSLQASLAILYSALFSSILAMIFLFSPHPEVESNHSDADHNPYPCIGHLFGCIFQP